ncbi:hypothetical protein Nepgr_018566 [Nepenthes gracilis]|uniref:Uncharacterized protein n=1 Tax=Nepenthes gracilis TaxID=150966 RepID=A0AAD3XUE0_NEPGR|nr:hypothetical protein Nepgr_018566 [Nepenthes gracilis]
MTTPWPENTSGWQAAFTIQIIPDNCQGPPTFIAAPATPAAFHRQQPNTAHHNPFLRPPSIDDSPTLPTTTPSGTDYLRNEHFIPR